MTTAALCGYGGSVTGAGTNLEVRDWEITIHLDTPEVTSMESGGWKERIGCLKGATGSLNSNKKPTIGAHAGASFHDSVAGYHIDGDIIINRIVDTTPVDGAVSYTSDFVFTGEVTAT